MTLDMAAGRYFDEVSLDLKHSKTLLQRLHVMTACYGRNVRLRDIDTALVADAIARRRGMGKRRPAAATVNRDLIDHTMRPLLNRARKVWGARSLQDINWTSVRLREPKGIVREYTQAEIDAWRGELEPEARLALDLLLTYGMRFGELMFTASAVDGAGRRLTLSARKAGDRLVLPLREDHARVLAAMASTRQPDQTVFSYTRDGLYSRLRTAAARAGLGARAIHGARHHAATTLLRATGNLKLTQALLGHASIQSTMRYAHASEADLRSAIEGLPRSGPAAVKETG
jgi:integrase